jgi:hypothetical protein
MYASPSNEISLAQDAPEETRVTDENADVSGRIRDGAAERVRARFVDEGEAARSEMLGQQREEERASACRRRRRGA